MRISFLVAIAAAGLMAAVLTAQTRSALGTPLAGITPVEFEEFRLGLEDFLEVEASEEGLGPAFNGTSCAVCHNIPTIGGAGTMAELRAGRRNANGEFETLNASGDTLFHMFSVPGHGCQPALPIDANVFARRVPIPLFGAGLVEAIPDETLIALEDPFDRNGDGVSGRAALIVDVESGRRRVGRFGWKAQHATLITFGADAYRNEMGITNDLFPQESAFAVTPEQMRLCDPFSDPEDIRDPRSQRRGIDNFASFMRFLAPVERGDMDDQVRAGEQSLQPSGARPATSRRWRQAPARIRCSIAREWRSFQICCSTTSGPATASSKGPRRPTKFARPRCGGCASGGHCCTTEPRRWKKRSAGTRGKPNSREPGSNV